MTFIMKNKRHDQKSYIGQIGHLRKICVFSACHFLRKAIINPEPLVPAQCVVSKIKPVETLVQENQTF